MRVINIAEVEKLEQLDLAKKTNENDAEKSMLFLGTFNQCMYGMVNFIGKTPWELHPDDEYLQVIDGDVEIIFLEEENGTTVSLSAGDTFVVPREVWHRQFSENGVKVMFITSSKENMHSTEDNPSK